jgi:hypothetical protein
MFNVAVLLLMLAAKDRVLEAREPRAGHFLLAVLDHLNVNKEGNGPGAKVNRVVVSTSTMSN